jgi:hypothetical protein
MDDMRIRELIFGAIIIAVIIIGALPAMQMLMTSTGKQRRWRFGLLNPNYG